jgi:ABC-type lipoprotein export system ATPase subunit
MTLLEFDGVCKTLRRRGPDHVVLQDVSFTVDEGEFVSILGDPGSGKSMLLQIAAGIEAPDAGSVLFTGQDLYAMSERQRTRLRAGTIGWARHPTPSRGRNVAEIVALSTLVRYGGKREIEEILDAVGMSELAEASWSELTAAEQRRVGLASALIRRPRLLLADDPFLGSDILQRQRLCLLLRSWVDEGGHAVLLATSEVTNVLGSDQLLALSRGSIIKPSPPAPAEVIDFPTRESRSA